MQSLSNKISRCSFLIWFLCWFLLSLKNLRNLILRFFIVMNPTNTPFLDQTLFIMLTFPLRPTPTAPEFLSDHHDQRLPPFDSVTCLFSPQSNFESSFGNARTPWFDDDSFTYTFRIVSKMKKSYGGDRVSTQLNQTGVFYENVREDLLLLLVKITDTC